MDDRAVLQALAAPDSGACSWIVFALAGERFALPMASVEAVAAPPPVAPVPHAAPALLGVGNLGGQIVPILDVAGLLGRERRAGGYDGSGEIIRLRIPGGSVGIWVDRVERLERIGPETRAEDGLERPGEIALIDPTPLVIAALAPPSLASGPPAPLGDVADRVLPAAVAALAEFFILVEVAGKGVRLRRESVVELVEAVPWTRMPRAPAGSRGVGMLRGTALPVLSLAALLGLAESLSAGGFAVIDLLGCRALLAVDRIIGLRFGRQPADPISSEQSAEGGETIDLGAAISEELRRIVFEFSQNGDDALPGDGAMVDEATEYLAFTVAGQDLAVPIGCVDRVVGAQPLIKLPRPANDDVDPAQLVGAIELRGQIVPVAALRSRLPPAGVGGEVVGPEPGAYVILRGGDGIGAIGVDRIKGVAALRPSDIAAPPAEHELIEGIAPGDGGLLRIIAPARLWRGG